MKYAIFIKTFKRDIEWLVYCLRSINKFCSGFDEIVVVAPDSERKEFESLGMTSERLVFQNEITKNGYVWQQAVKMRADEFTDADRILFVDSDCIFFKPVTPEYFLHEGKPYILYTEFDRLGNTVPWRKGSEFVLKQSVPYEFMRRHPAMYNRDTLRRFRDFVGARLGLSTDDMMIQKGNPEHISEFNVIGAYAFYNEHDDYVWFDTEDHKHPPDCLQQFWSYGGTGGMENRARLEELKGLLK